MKKNMQEQIHSNSAQAVKENTTTKDGIKIGKPTGQHFASRWPSVYLKESEINVEEIQKAGEQ